MIEVTRKVYIPTAPRGIGVKKQVVYCLILSSFFGGVFLWSAKGALFYKVLLLGMISLALCCGSLTINKRYLTLLVLLVVNFAYYFINGVLLSGSVFQQLLLSQTYLFFLLLYICFSSVSVSVRDVEFLRKAFLFIVITQLILSFVKFIVLGRIDEGFLIGSMSHNAGQLSFLFPACCIPVVFFLFFRRHKGLFVFFLSSLFLFGLLNEKRSIVYLGPVLCFLSYLAVAPERFNLRKCISIAAVVCLISIVPITISQLIPSLNGSEGNIEAVGQFSYLFVYAVEYLFADYGGALQAGEDLAAFDTNVQLGRMIIWASVINTVINSDVLTILFGHGNGFITPSGWVNGDDIMFDRLGYRGAICGAALSLIEGGVVGLLLNSAIFFTFYLRIRSNIRTLQNTNYILWAKCIRVMFLVFLYDFFFYSLVLFRTFPMPTIFFLAFCSLVHVEMLEKKSRLKSVKEL